ERMDVGAGDEDLAGVDGVEAGRAIEERRLADARLADDGDELAGLENEVDAFEDRARAVALGETGDGEDRISQAGLSRHGGGRGRRPARRRRQRRRRRPRATASSAATSAGAWRAGASPRSRWR